MGASRFRGSGLKSAFLPGLVARIRQMAAIHQDYAPRIDFVGAVSSCFFLLFFARGEVFLVDSVQPLLPFDSGVTQTKTGQKPSICWNEEL